MITTWQEYWAMLECVVSYRRRLYERLRGWLASPDVVARMDDAARRRIWVRYNEVARRQDACFTVDAVQPGGLA